MADEDSPTTSNLRRRSVLVGAAWTVPVVASVTAAPAFAASPCATTSPGTINFAAGGNYTRSTFLTGTATVPIPNQTPLLATFADVVPPNYLVYTNSNLTTTGVFGSSVGLTLYHERVDFTPTPFPSPVLTITFSRPVYNLVVPFKDLTYPFYAGNGTYRDTVFTVPSPTSSALGSSVSGSGTAGDPYLRTNQANVNFPPTPDVTATATYAGPILALAINYYDSYANQFGGLHGGQAIQIGNISFDTKPVGCP